jgi:hypothetical protein
MDLIKNDKPGATTDVVVIDVDELGRALLEFTRWSDGADHYARVFEGDVSNGRVQVSRCGFEYLQKVASRDRLMMLARAMPFAIANDRPRVICHDFAMVFGARTDREVDEWLSRERLKSRSTTVQSLNVPAGYE